MTTHELAYLLLRVPDVTVQVETMVGVVCGGPSAPLNYEEAYVDISGVQDLTSEPTPTVLLTTEK